jgi:hypothetical protein
MIEFIRTVKGPCKDPAPEPTAPVEEVVDYFDYSRAHR